MEIELKDLFDLVAKAVDAGVQTYIRSVEPSKDHINQAEAKEYISKMGFRPATLRKWVEEKLVHPVKTGDRQNATVLYSLAELKKVIASLELKSITNGARHDRVFL